MASYLLMAAIVYRLTLLIVYDEGPFGVCRRLRSAIDPAQRTWIGRGITCPLCVSFWLALPGGLILQQDVWYLNWLAIAGIVAFIVRVTHDEPPPP